MKTIKKTLAILFITMVGFGCGNSDQTPTASLGYFLKAKIDGVQYDTGTEAFRVVASSDTDRINITSVLTDSRNFEFIIDRPTGLGTYNYPMPSGVDYVLSLSYGDATSTALWRTGACSGTTGALTITALSATEISGTFSFTGKKNGDCSSKTITEGSFKALLIQ